jgi:hypothetical protein
MGGWVSAVERPNAKIRIIPTLQTLTGAAGNGSGSGEGVR